MGLNRTDAARTSYEKTRDLLRALVKQHPAEEYEAMLAWCLHDLAHVYQDTGKIDLGATISAPPSIFGRR